MRIDDQNTTWLQMNHKEQTSSFFFFQRETFLCPFEINNINNIITSPGEHSQPTNPVMMPAKTTDVSDFKGCASFCLQTDLKKRNIVPAKSRKSAKQCTCVDNSSVRWSLRLRWFPLTFTLIHFIQIDVCTHEDNRSQVKSTE